MARPVPNAEKAVTIVMVESDFAAARKRRDRTCVIEVAGERQYGVEFVVTKQFGLVYWRQGTLRYSVGRDARKVVEAYDDKDLTYEEAARRNLLVVTLDPYEPPKPRAAPAGTLQMNSATTVRSRRQRAIRNIRRRFKRNVSGVLYKKGQVFVED